MRRSFSALGWGLATVLLLALAPGMARAHKVVEVHVTNNQFTPEFVLLDIGDTVRWVFDEGVHNTDSVDGEWQSGDLPAGSTFEYTFMGTGQYDYYCSLHIDCCNMAATIYVQDRPPVKLKRAPGRGDGSR